MPPVGDGGTGAVRGAENAMNTPLAKGATSVVRKRRYVAGVMTNYIFAADGVELNGNQKGATDSLKDASRGNTIGGGTKRQKGCCSVPFALQALYMGPPPGSTSK